MLNKKVLFFSSLASPPKEPAERKDIEILAEAVAEVRNKRGFTIGAEMKKIILVKFEEAGLMEFGTGSVGERRSGKKGKNNSKQCVDGQLQLLKRLSKIPHHAAIHG